MGTCAQCATDHCEGCTGKYHVDWKRKGHHSDGMSRMALCECPCRRPADWRGEPTRVPSPGDIPEEALLREFFWRGRRAPDRNDLGPGMPTIHRVPEYVPTQAVPT